jgi:hypothetical protein
MIGFSAVQDEEAERSEEEGKIMSGIRRTLPPRASRFSYSPVLHFTFLTIPNDVVIVVSGGKECGHLSLTNNRIKKLLLGMRFETHAQ